MSLFYTDKERHSIMTRNPLLKAQLGITTFAFTALLIGFVLMTGVPTLTPTMVTTAIFAWFALFMGGMVLMFKY